MTDQRGAKLSLVLSVFLFGTIGVFVRHIPLPSSVIALVRGAVGAALANEVELPEKKGAIT